MSDRQAQGNVSDEELAAMQRRLAELRAQKARENAAAVAGQTAGPGVASSAPAFNVQATPFIPSGGGGGGGQTHIAPAAASYATPGAASYAAFSQNGSGNHYSQAHRGGGAEYASYEDDADNGLYYEDDDDGYDEGYDEDYFDEGNMDFAPMDDGIGAGWNTSNFSGDVGVMTATPAKVARREVGDFEQLRLAKMGDLQSFKAFETMSHTDITNLTDNKGRNALHYAADGGNVELVAYLASKRVPAITDYKDMTPMDIAVLTNDVTMQNALADKFEKLAEQQLRDSQRMSADQMHLHAVKTFAPAPPKFTISKPTPPKVDQKAQHLFWRDAKSQTDSSAAQASAFQSKTRTVPAPDANVEVLKQYKLCTSDGDGDDVPVRTVLYHPGATEKMLAACGTRITASVVEEDESVVGAVMSLQLGGRLVGPSGGNSTASTNPTYVSDLAVTQSYKGKGVTVALLDDIQKTVKGAAIFHTSYHIPPAAIGTIKWYQRTFDPIKLFKNRSFAEELLPEFFEYDEFLRADYAAKGEITEGVDSVEDLSEWCAIDANIPQHVSGVHEFLVKALTTGQVDAKIAYVPESEADTREVILGSCSHAFARVSAATGSVVDFVAFRIVSPHEAKAECVAGQEDPNGSFASPLTAVCVFAVIPTKKGITKMMSLLHLCKLLHCSALLVPNMFGFADADTAPTHFEELHQHRELLYILKDRSTSLFPATPMVKTFVPVAFM